MNRQIFLDQHANRDNFEGLERFFRMHSLRLWHRKSKYVLMKASVPPFRVNRLSTFRQKLIYREELLLFIVSLPPASFVFVNASILALGANQIYYFWDT